MVDPERFPNIVEALQEAGLDPTTQRVPVAPASHYVMGGIVTDLDGRATGVDAPVRGRRVRLHRPARRQPARVELAQRVLRVRPPRRARGARRRAARGRCRRSTRDVQAPTRETREAVWRARRPGAQRARTSRACSEDPYPLARLVAASALRPPGDARLARPRRVPGARPRPRRPPHDPGPRTPRRRASRHGRTPDRLGRRAHDEHVGLLRRVQPPRGTARGTAVLDDVPAASRHAGRPRVRDDRPARVRAPRWPRALDVDPDGLAQAPHAPTSSPTSEMRDAVKRYHDAGITTALVSNSWRRRRLRRRPARDVRRRRALARRSGSASPTRGSTTSRSTASDSPPSAACSSMT